MTKRNLGLANQHMFFMNYVADRKVTPGVMGQYVVRVQIKLRVCYFVVGSSCPGYAEVPKG